MTEGDLVGKQLLITGSWDADPIVLTRCVDEVDGSGFYNCEGPTG